MREEGKGCGCWSGYERLPGQYLVKRDAAWKKRKLGGWLLVRV
jgi:hypothetical protein